MKELFSSDRNQYLPPLAGEDEEMLQPEELTAYLVALSACAPMLNKSCAGLIRALLKCSWLGRDEKFYQAYVQLLASLVSANGSTLIPVLTMM